MFDDYYGLTGKPFQLTPDPAFYVDIASHRKAQACLGYGLGQGEGFIVVTGEAGSGKSTLAAHVLGMVDPAQLTAAQFNADVTDDADLISAVALAFGLDAGGHEKTSALQSIESFLHSEAHAGRRCLLIADDAERLSFDALNDLRRLSDIRPGSRSPLQTLLLGRPELRATLRRDSKLEPLRQRMVAAHHLEPMTRTEIEPYIVHRLERVGWSGRPQFDQRVIAELHAASDGIPLRVNQIAGRLLVLGAVDRRSRIDAVMLRTVLDELAAEGAFEDDWPDAGLVATALAGVSPRQDEPQLDPDSLAAALAERDAQITELQQAVAELAGGQGNADPASHRAQIEELGLRVAALEARVEEQERALRRTLAMLIDWIDREGEQSRAA